MEHHVVAPLADAARRLRRRPGRPRRTQPAGPTVQGAPLTHAADAALRGDFAASLPRWDWPRGLPLPLAARYAGIPTRRLWALIAAGRLPAVRVPGMRAVLVLRDDLDALLLAHRDATRCAPERVEARG
jgi:excisionase family DNA binding protein